MALKIFEKGIVAVPHEHYVGISGGSKSEVSAMDQSENTIGTYHVNFKRLGRDYRQVF